MKSKNDIPEIDKELIKSPNHFPVVGIGASAGGLDAFKKLLKAIPADSGMAYVLVQHLDPSHESMLVEILQKVTDIPVLEIADDIKVQPNHIYILPSNKMIIANDGVLELTPRSAKSKMERNLPIDLFFTSLAEVHQSHAIGVVLSGTANDGTMGLKAIKEQGGITFAQDEASAAYEGMPHSAVEAGVVDFVLPPDKIPQKLLELISIIKGKDVEHIAQQDEDVFKQILSLLRIRKGTDFTYYKPSTIRRRILRRMAINKTEEPSVYLKYLREKKPEQDLLYQDLLIPVTDFFRDPKIFDSLSKAVFPLILKNKKEGEPIRIWVAGCSTGEEVYSMAICFKELLGDRFSEDVHQRVQIFATDISEPAIAKARNGIYSKTNLIGLSQAHLKEYFTKNNGDYQAKKSIRDLCVFAVHNFLKDPAFSKMDFISCRNVLIYMEPYLQKKALITFHYALNQKGFLLLGKSETTSGVPDHFGVCLLKGTAKTDKIFIRKDIASKFVPTASLLREKSFADPNVSSKSEAIRTDFQKTADDIMLSKYTPAGVVVNETLDIVHFRGNTGHFLEPSPGKASLNLLKMAKEGLAFELRNILHKAKKENTTILKENIPIQINGIQTNISVEAIPLPNVIEPHYLVLFHQKAVDSRQLAVGNKQATVTNKRETANEKRETRNAQNLRIAQLEKELAQSREDMRSITEDQEAANEELQSANEELLSGSEELQSLNEEMETSKEELQSTNEELTVVNQEIIGLNEQITEARDYAEAIISNLYEPLLVLDKNLRIKSANSSFYKTFEVNEKDTEGKFIYDLGNKQWDIPALRELLQNILWHKSKLENFEISHNFPNIGERIVLLNARELVNETGSEKLILLAIADITEQKNARKKIEESEQRFRTLVIQAPVAIGIYKGKKYIAEVVNELALQMLNAAFDFIGKPLFDVLPELENQGLKTIMDNVLQSGTTYYGNELEFTIHKKNISTQGFYNLIIQQLKADNESITGIIIVASEVTEQVLARKKVEESEHQYHNLIYTSPCMIAIFKGKDTIIEIANDAIIETWGKGKDIIGKPLFEVLPEAVEQGFDKLIQNVFETGEPFHAYEKPVTLVRNGKQQLMHYNFIYQAQRNVQGEIVGVAILANEVTPQVEAKMKILESEERFRLLADNMPLNVFLADATAVDNITYLNKYWLNFTKQTFDEAIASGWLNIVHPDDVQLVRSIYEPAFKAKQAYTIAQFRIKRYDGQYIWFTFHGNPRYLPNGEYVGYMGIGLDINEQKLFEIELIDEKLKAENAAKSKQQFLANMSHEIRTPLNSIVGFANVLTKTNLTDKQKVYLDAIKKSGQTLNLLINDILDLAKVDAGKITFEKNPFELYKSLHSVLHSFDFKIKEKKLKLLIEYDSEIPFMVVGDTLRLNQIILNLMSNAIKFTHEGKIIFKVKKIKEDDENIIIKFTITDTGIGIAENKIDLIFNLFEQAEINTSNSYGGTGLGLAIVKKLVESQGGKINAVSNLGKGSTFTFVLPFEKTKIKTNEEIEKIKIDNTLKNIKVLVAEDVVLNQMLIKIILGDFGFEFEVVENGKVLIEKLQTNTYDLILMDLQMPEMNGFEATDYIRNTMKLNIPIIALTADVTTADVVKCKKFGMNDYLSKPIDEKQLYNKIEQLIKK